MFTFEKSAYVFVSKMVGPGGFVVDNILVSMVRKVYGSLRSSLLCDPKEPNKVLGEI